MSLNSLKIATDGYLKRTTKAVLVIAVAGYLNFGGTPPTPPDNNGDNSGGGGGMIVNSFRDPDYERYQQLKEKKRKEEEQERIKLDDDLIFNVIKIWTEKCKT